MCHKRWTRPPSQPGDPVPPDNDDLIYLSPDVCLSKAALPTMLPAGGAPITIPTVDPAPRPTPVSAVENAIAAFRPSDPALTTGDLGLLRLELLHELARLPDDGLPLDWKIAEAIAQSAVLAWQTAGTLALTASTLLWNEELDASTFIGRTILLADHVLTPDALVAAIGRTPTNARIRELALRELRNAPLIRSGRLLAVPSGTALVLGRDSAHALAAADLKNESLTSFIRAQLVVEGPTAREVLFVNAKDDLSHTQRMWFYAHIDAKNLTEDGGFRTKMLGQYNPVHDYGPWIQQTVDGATRDYVQRTAERMVVADLVGAEYVAASPFEARIMQRRDPMFNAGVGSTAIWADVPALRDLSSKDLVRILSEDEAVEDLRARVRLAMRSAADFGGQVEAVRELSAEIEQASTGLERKIRTERAFSAIAPAALGGAGLAIGSAGGLPGFAAAALGTVAGVVPWIGSRKNNRREAAFVFVAARRARQKRH